MGGKYIKSLKKPNKFEDFVAYTQKHPNLTISQLKGTYNVSTATIINWRKKLKDLENKDQVPVL